jgi:hypothetical protein
MIRFLCPHCLRKMKAPAAMVLKPVGCPRCHKPCRVPPLPPLTADQRARRKFAVSVSVIAAILVSGAAVPLGADLYVRKVELADDPEPSVPFTLLMKDALRRLLGL